MHENCCLRRWEVMDYVSDLREKVKNKPETEDPLFNNPTFSDFQIKAGSKTFYTTKHQLALKSEVFQRMFESKMKEADEDVLELSDDPDVVEAMLKHISMRKKVEGGKLARKVVKIAHRYQLTELMEQCELEMIDKMSVEDARESLRVADQLELPLLLLKCCQFIYYNGQVDNTEADVLKISPVIDESSKERTEFFKVTNKLASPIAYETCTNSGRKYYDFLFPYSSVVLHKRDFSKRNELLGLYYVVFDDYNSYLKCARLSNSKFMPIREI